MVLGTQSFGEETGRVEYSLRRDERRGLYRLSFQAMGTRCGALFEATHVEQARGFCEAAVRWVSRFEQRYSRFLDTSLVSEVNRCAGKRWVDIDSEMEALLALCEDLHFMTGGLLDATSGPLVKLWDWRSGGSRFPSETEVDDAMRLVGWKKVQRRDGGMFLPEEGMSLDFGGFGKEFAVDAVAELAWGHELAACLIDFGRDIRTIGVPSDAPAWHIGLEDPERPGAVRRSLAVGDGLGVATSGDGQRYFEKDGVRYGHIVDPRTGRPALGNLRSVSVVASSCLEAGVLSTAAFTAGVEEGVRLIEEHYAAEAEFSLGTATRQTSRFHEYTV